MRYVWPEWLHEIAVNAVCPINRDPITPFEVNMVKTLEEFGQQVLNKYVTTASEGYARSESAPIWKPVSANDATRGVAWIDEQATHIGKIEGGQRYLMQLPEAPK